MSETVTLHVAWGSSPSRMGTVIADLLKTPPLALWCEPTPRKERLPNFASLWLKDFSTLPDGIALDEARLFWVDGWVHLLTTRAGTRWAAFREGNMPTWLAQPAKTDQWGGVQRKEQNVLLLEDWKRYGLPELKQLPKTCLAHLYTHRSQLVGWKLGVRP